jgi:RHS repeat-associated protein
VRSYLEKLGAEGEGDWLGSLLRDQRDPSGFLYRRNRYYDPMAGRFTQPDPIGLAGGINLYGFAGGDPANFADPFGLQHCDPPPQQGEVCEPLKEYEHRPGKVGEYGAPRVGGRKHAGFDMAADLNAPVRSPVDGTVIFVRDELGATERGKGYQSAGNNVLIEFSDSDGNARFVRMGHFAEFHFVKEGRELRAGDLVGWVGASGNAARAGPGGTPVPMLHIEFRKDAAVGFRGSLNPALFLGSLRKSSK